MKNTKELQSSTAVDAIALLIQDHKEVRKMFDDYEDLGDKAEAAKVKLAQRICGELTVHMQIEEEIFYPAVRKATGDEDLVDEADVEHAAAKELIAQIKGEKPSESHYDAKVKVLGEEIEHHVKEEEGEMFPEAKKTKLDMKALGAQMSERKSELKAQLGLK